MVAVLIVLLLIAPSIQYRLDLGPFSIALMEPITLLAVGVFLLRQIWERGTIVIARDPLLPLLTLLAIWVLLIRPWGSSITRGLSDVRDWWIPVLGSVALLATVRTGWSRWLGAALVGVVLQAGLGLYQVWTDSARPFVNAMAIYKTGFTISLENERLLQTSFAAGLFSHPNSMAMYLLGGLLLVLTWPTTKLWARGARWVGLGLIGLTLYLTYAKSSLLVLGVAMVWYILLRLVRSAFWVVVISIVGAGVTILVGWSLWAQIPPAFLETFYWRLGLWQIAWDQIQARPLILLFGNGMDRFGQIAYHTQPHNTYLFMTLEYGLFGLVWLLASLAMMVKLGLQMHTGGWFRHEPRLLGLWIFLLSYAVIGFVETNLLTVEDRALFLLTWASFFGLYREAQAQLSAVAMRYEAVDAHALPQVEGAVSSVVSLRSM